LKKEKKEKKEIVHSHRTQKEHSPFQGGGRVFEALGAVAFIQEE
jgi:hypothetical protein